MVSESHMLIYFLAAAVAVLSWAVAFQYKERAALMREIIEANSENVRLWHTLATAFQKLSDDMGAMSEMIANHLLKK